MNHLDIRFLCGEQVTEVRTAVSKLVRENNQEVMHTRCGLKILLDQIISVNGISFAP